MQQINIACAEYVPSHTFSGRAGQPLFLTATYPKSDKPHEKRKIGSEVMTKIIAPSGYKLVAFDFSGQEQILFALIGDAAFGFIGATATSNATLVGDKNQSTDAHSVLAKQFNISRAAAKTANYALQFGAGAAKLAETLWVADKKHPDRPLKYWQKIAEKIVLYKRGKKRGLFLHGGTDSHSYNGLTVRSMSEEPREPCLNRLMPTSGHANVCQSDFKRARDNFWCQGTGASMLSMTISVIELFVQEQNINAWLALTVHDQIVYYCEDKDVQQFMCIMQKAHLYAYASVCRGLGLNGIPTAVAFADSIEVMQSLTKAIGSDTTTLSTPQHEFEDGQAYTPHDIFA